ncbi:MAG: sigma-70 family RNA polymerase sigma factor [Deltaproteobacteria bacterium]|nr:sigma-70 family RNA polymerase sigma factor [Deltaproteobacteria bacterium]
MGWLSRQKDPVREEFEANAFCHLDALYSHALHLTRSRADAEDLVQDTFLKAFKSFDQFERGTNFRAWLFRIQFNTFVNRYRRATREHAVNESLSREPVGDSVFSRAVMQALVDPDSEALRPVIAREIENALDTLPEDYRVIILLADVEELSYKEIAQVLGCPIGTVMSRLHRARRMLQKQLIEYAEQLGILNHRTNEEMENTVSLEAYRRDGSK